MAFIFLLHEVYVGYGTLQHVRFIVLIDCTINPSS